MVLFKQCCCCISLRKGVEIIGWLALVGNFLQLIAFTVNTTSLKDDNNSVMSKENAMEFEILAPLIVFVSIKVLAFICAIFLILGATKMNKTYLIPHLVLESISIILMAIYIIVQLVYKNGYILLQLSFVLGLGKL